MSSQTKTKKTVVTKTAPKQSKKVVAKKAAATKKTIATKKKPLAKKTTEKKMVTAKGSDCFWVHNGPILKHLADLEVALVDMTEATFKHHTAGAQNDFVVWIEHTLKDAETAAKFQKSKKPQTARVLIAKQLKLYKLPK